MDNEKLIEELGKLFENLSKQMGNNAPKLADLSTDQLKERLKQTNEQLKNNTQTLTSYQQSLADAIKANENEIKGRKALFNMGEKNWEALKGQVTQLNFVTDATKAWSAVLTADVNGISLAAQAASAALKGVSAVASEVGDGFFALAMVFRNPIVKGISVTLGFLSKMVGASTEKLGQINEVLAVQADILIKNFRDISSAGVTFADGMSGFKRMSLEAGIRTEELARIVKKNSGIIAESGLGLNKGTELISKVISQTSKQYVQTGNGAISLREQMMNLGYTVEEQGELAAETIAMIRRSGGQINEQDSKEIAQRTAEYAKNLKVISQVTGEDAKKKMKEAQDVANNIAFNAKLREVARAKFGDDEKSINNYIEGVVKSLATMPTDLQKATKEQVLFGTALGDTAAALAVTPQELQTSVSNYSTAILNGSSNIETFSNAVNNALVDFRNMPGEAVVAISRATAAGQTQAVGTILQNIFGDSLKRTEDGVGKAREAVDKAAITNDQLTQDMIAVTEASRDLQLAIEDLTFTALGSYSRTIAEGTKITKDLIDWYKNFFGKESTETQNPTGEGDSLGTGASNGAVLSGPKSGYKPNLEMHGTEAIVPLPDGRSIPVDIGSNLADFSNFLTNFARDFAKDNKQFADINSESNSIRDIKQFADINRESNFSRDYEQLSKLDRVSNNNMNNINLDPIIDSMHEQNTIGKEMLRYMRNMVDAQEKLVRAT